MRFPALKFFLISIAAIFFFNCVYSQAIVSGYHNEWKKVDDLITKKLTKSALTQVDQIYAAAKKQNNDPQVIKALLYRIFLLPINRLLKV